MQELTKKQISEYLISYFTFIPVAKPLFINFGLTHQCNLRCKICETWKFGLRRENELSVGEIKYVIRQIAEWDKNINVSFAGGEPLLRRKKLIEAIKCAKKLGLTTHVTSNGTLVNREIAEELVLSGLDYLQFSLDGAKAKTNDYIRGKGTFRKVMKAIREIKRAKRKFDSDLKLSLTSVVCNKNIDELLDIVKLVEKLGLYEVSFNPYNVDTSYMKNKDYDNDEFWVKKENISKLRKICKKLIEIKKTKGIIGTPYSFLELMPDYFEKKIAFREGLCTAGYSYMYIKPDGTVDVCGKGPSLNVREHSLKAIWHSLEFMKTRLKVIRCKRPCLMLCFPRIKLGNVVRR
ncbi:MAG: radical SAM protein [Candidatus Aenigmarchaeota archaeon]|nr:radical SAM protein [Candidatus Aenigmarchaeota archaeon]